MEKENRTFATGFKWSTEVIILTSFTFVVILGVIASFYPQWPAGMLWMKYLIVMIVLSIVVIPAAYCPMRLSVDDERIVLKRVVGKLEIKLTEVRSITVASKKDISGSIRTFGSGGLYGFLGHFYNKKLGHYIMYATDRRSLVYIRTAKGKYIFSTPQPQAFVDATNGKLQALPKRA
ncbi:MAG: PH domain-containing protein [Prevotellaceae bacterium]|jgi:hypothetical protein|nr:PH domain-containing protein [Prevotellaceae bacterium]